MTAFATPDSPKPLVTKNVVAYILIAMLVATAVMSGLRTFPNENSLLAIFWPLSMFVLANYWLHLYLDEHSYIEDVTHVRSRPSYLGLPLIPAV